MAGHDLHVPLQIINSMSTSQRKGCGTQSDGPMSSLHDVAVDNSSDLEACKISAIQSQAASMSTGSSRRKPARKVSWRDEVAADGCIASYRLFQTHEGFPVRRTALWKGRTCKVQRDLAKCCHARDALKFVLLCALTVLCAMGTRLKAETRAQALCGTGAFFFEEQACLAWVPGFAGCFRQACFGSTIVFGLSVLLLIYRLAGSSGEEVSENMV